MSALLPKADMLSVKTDVCLVPRADPQPTFKHANYGIQINATSMAKPTTRALHPESG